MDELQGMAKLFGAPHTGSKAELASVLGLIKTPLRRKG
jgi:hypothetical protein